MNEKPLEDWKQIPIGDLGIFFGGLTGKTTKDFGEGSAFLTYMQVYLQKTSQKEAVDFVVIDGHEKQNKVVYGDILFTTSSETPDEIGMTDVFLESDWSPYLNSFCFGLRVRDNSLLYPPFTKYLLRGNKFREKIRPLAQGSTRFNLSKGNLAKISLLFPPLTEQKKIASILTSVDEVIEKTQKQINKLQDLKKATMNELLTKGIGHTEFKDSELGKIPKNWEAVKLSDMLKLMTDFVANGSFEALRNNIKVLDKVDYALYVRLYDLRLGLGHAKQKYVPKDTYDFLQKSSIETNDLLIANIGANVGEVFMMPSTIKPATIAPNMILMRCNHKVANPHFLFEFLSSDIGKRSISVAISGSGQPKINKTDLKEIKILVPTIYEQNIISSVMKSLDDIILKKMKKLTQTQSLKKSLMQNLLTGKVRVKVN